MRYCHSIVFIAVPSQQVIDLRPGSCFRLFHAILPLFQDLMDFACRVVQIAEYPDLRWTGFHTSRELPAIQAMRAQIAFLDYAKVLAKETCIVWAGNHAVAATNALRRIHCDYAIRALIRGSGGANSHAGWSFAVVTLFRLKNCH